MIHQPVANSILPEKPVFIPYKPVLQLFRDRRGIAEKINVSDVVGTIKDSLQNQNKRSLI